MLTLGTCACIKTTFYYLLFKLVQLILNSCYMWWSFGRITTICHNPKLFFSHTKFIPFWLLYSFTCLLFSLDFFLSFLLNPNYIQGQFMSKSSMKSSLSILSTLIIPFSKSLSQRNSTILHP